MKTKLIFLSMIVLHGCAPSDIPRQSQYFGVDFTPYSNKGFLITPEKYTSDYESIGIVNYTLMPSARLVVIRKDKLTTGATDEIKGWEVEQITLSQGLDSLYNRASQMGADAIVSFTWKVEERTYEYIKNPLTISGYALSGYAIKRKK